MKKSSILILFILSSSLSGCLFWGEGDDTTNYGSNYEPIIMNRSDFENSVTLENAKVISKTGKIYVKGSYLFINEPNEGFHIFNNSNPRNPIKRSFLKVLGSTDITIKSNVLYINTATDLIAIQTNSTYTTIEVTKRIENIFPKMTSPDGYDHYELLDTEVITNWILKD